MLWTQKSALEVQLGVRILVRRPLLAWLAKWPGDVLAWRAKGHDRLILYKRSRGKSLHTRLAALRETVRYKVRSREPASSDGQ